MKPFKVMLCIFLLCSVAASAQRKNEATNNNTKINSSTNNADTMQTPTSERIGTLLTFDQLDPRKIYRWENGQSATPSGREAGGNIGRYVRVFGDSAVVIKDPMQGKERDLTKNQ
jgi:hypothetical protein